MRIAKTFLLACGLGVFAFGAWEYNSALHPMFGPTALVAAQKTEVAPSSSKRNLERAATIIACGTEMPLELINHLRELKTSGKLRPLSVATISDEDVFRPFQAALNDYIWKEVGSLRIRFLDGSPNLQNKVIAAAQYWTNYAKINFKFGSDPEAEIRISLTHNNQYESLLGKQALKEPKNAETMHLGFKDPPDDITDEQFKGLVLHEFGHALGLIHEHQSPTAKISWNKEYVYKYYFDTYRWARTKVDEFVFRQYSPDGTSFSTLDPYSIMMYRIPKEFTTDGFSTPDNNQLSEVDKQFIQTLYSGRQ